MGAVSFFGVSQLLIMNGQQDSARYYDIFGNGLLPFVAELFDENLTRIFKQENAPIHTSAYTTQWLFDYNVRTLPWPARSSDCIIIENLWSILVRKVYSRGRQFSDTDDLMDEIQASWEDIDRDIIFKLYRSIPKRLLAVTDANGGETKYYEQLYCTGTSSILHINFILC